MEPMPEHILAFRAVVAPTPYLRPAVLKATWRALLPGLAQIWYRFVVLWRHHWPYKLLLLLNCEYGAGRQIAIDLLHSRECCFGQGGSIAIDLYDLAHALYDDEEEQIQFLLGPWCIKVIQAWSRKISITIQDVECGNAWVKRAMPTGRPHTLASLAAKGLIQDSISQFFAVHNQWPNDKFKDSAVEILKDLRNKKKVKKNSRATCGYDLFRKEHFAMLRDRGVSFKHATSPETQLSVSEAYAKLSLEELLGYNLDADATIAHAPTPNAVPHGACTAVVPSSRLGPLGAILPYAKPDLRCYEMVSVHGEPPLGILAYFRMIIGIVTN